MSNELNAPVKNRVADWIIKQEPTRQLMLPTRDPF